MQLKNYRAKAEDVYVWRIAAAKAGYVSFSAFIRDAITEKAAKVTQGATDAV